VSGKVIGQEYGVAKNANIQAVKILNKRGEGSTALLLKGKYINFSFHSIFLFLQEKKKKKNRNLKSYLFS
jgi:hypothetical protein